MNFDELSWLGAEGDYDGHALLIRLRQLPEDFPTSRYPLRLNVTWTMSEPDENGLPGDEEWKGLVEFEDRLVDAVENDEHSILVGILTCNGQREFIFYTADVTGFVERLTDMPQEEERYPITIEAYDDSEWSYYQAVMSQLEE